MLAYVSNSFYFPSVTNGEVVEIPLNESLLVQQLTVSQAAAGGFNLTVYRRPFVPHTRVVSSIKQDTATGLLLVKFTRRHWFRPKDQIAITSTVNYNGMSEVVSVPDACHIVANTTYIADEAVGSFQQRAVIESVTNDGYNKCLVNFTQPHLLEEGNAFSVISCSVAGYNTTFTVLNRINDNTVLTNVNYTDAGFGGLATLAVASAQYPVYEMWPLTAASSGVVRLTDSVGRPVGASAACRNNERRLFLLISASGDYHVTVAGQMYVRG